MANAVKNRVGLIGLELEGGWKAIPAFHVEHDGSVKFPPFVRRPPPAGAGAAELLLWKQKEAERAEAERLAILGEAVSEPFEPKHDDIVTYITTHFPDRVNESCGLHVHMSFQHRLNYQRLMCPEFTTAMVNGLLKWSEEEKLPADHPLWPRLTEKNHRHCAHLYLGDNQVLNERKDYNSRGTPQSRYTAINYCFRMHKTVECRLLSMFDTPEQSIRAVEEVIHITNVFLAKTAAKEKRVGARTQASTALKSVYRATIAA